METKSIQLIKSQESYKLTVTQNLERMIRFLCKKLPNNEWSGTLFYTVEGSFEDNNLHIICKDFYLQDVGESTYTEFQRDASLVSYMVDHDLLDCYTGLLHSHDNMSAFFSGTDQSTLREEGAEQNHFLSLIVNNAGTYAAAITKKIKAIVKGERELSYNTFGNTNINGTSEHVESEVTYVEYYPLDITVESVPEEPKSELELRLEEVRKSSNSYINRKSFILPSSSYNTFNHKDVEYSTTEKKVPFDYTQNYMFSNEEMGVPEKPSNPNLNNDIPYGKVHANKDAVKSTVYQVITGDLFASYKQNIDINKWVDNMETLYSKRFPKIEEGKQVSSSFEYWVDTLVDALADDFEDENLFVNDPDVATSIWAYDVIEELNMFPKNKYLDIIIKSFERWIL